MLAYKERRLNEKMSRLGVRQEDIVESFVRSSAPGGQKVNKASTCVYLKHIPTSIEVKCQRERSQALNRFIAREILIRKIENFILERVSQERQRREKLKRQKRGRSKKSRLKILEQKRRHAQKKLFRAAVRQIE